MSNRHLSFGNKIVPVALGALLVLCGLYFALLYYAPNIPNVPIIGSTAIDLNTSDDMGDTSNRIQIEKLNLEVPYFSGENEVLNKGAWHRFPENGDPSSGGNFVLAAHRFELGMTPNQTKQKSPFYHIDELQNGDEIKVMHNGKWYTYTVSKKYEVPPTALYIENRSAEPKLTLYSCSLQGSAAGRYVIEARPI